MTLPRSTRGFTLLEAVIALSILLVAVVGLFELQIWGLSANQGARAHGQALDLARELAGALSRLDPDDPALAATSTEDAPPDRFGRVYQADGSLDASELTEWDDALLVPGGTIVGVRPDWAIERDLTDPALPLYARRWAVWELPSAAASSGLKLIAVSVVYREKAIPQPREVILYAHVANTGAALTNANAYR